MTKKTHICVSVAATLPIIIILRSPYALIGLVGSIAPDWDIRLGIKHRTITHSFITLIVTTIVLFLFNNILGLIWGLNYLIHLILDSFTVTGVPLFHPFRDKYYGFKLIRTGEVEDLLICLVAVLIILSLV